MNKNCSNLEREIQRCLILSNLSDSFLSESRFMKMLRDELKGVAKEMQPHLDNLYALSDFLGNYELMDLEFINAFGIYEFIEALNNTCTIEAFLDLCGLVCQAIEFSALDSSYFGYFKDYKRAKRRASEVRTRTRAIQLGSTAIYSKDLEDSEDSEDDSLLPGKLVRSKGIIIKKLDTAARESREHVRAETAIKISNHARHLIRLAEVYKDYTVLYRGRYFKVIDKDVQLSDISEDTTVKNGKKDVYFVQIPEELAGYEYRYSGQYVKAYHGNVIEDADTVGQLYPSEKGDIPRSIRRNKHYTSASPSSKKRIDEANMFPCFAYCEMPLTPFITVSGRSYGFL